MIRAQGAIVGWAAPLAASAAGPAAFARGRGQAGRQRPLRTPLACASSSAACFRRCPISSGWSSSPSCSRAPCPATRRPISPAPRRRRHRWSRCAASASTAAPRAVLPYVGDLARGDLGFAHLRPAGARGPPPACRRRWSWSCGAVAGAPSACRSACGGAPPRLARSTGSAAWSPRPAVPTFFLGLALVFVFYYLLDWAPAPLGRLDIVWSSPDGHRLLVDRRRSSPATSSFRRACRPARPAGDDAGACSASARSPARRGPAMIEVLGSDFVRTARAAGLSRRKVL